MAGSFDAKVEISTADAVNNLRNLKKEVHENAAAFRDFNKALKESKQNVVLAAQQMTQLAKARAENARVTQQETKTLVDVARATAIKTQADAKAGQEAAKKAMYDRRAEQATAQRGTAEARTAAIQERATRAAANAAAASNRQTESLSNTRYMMYDVGATLGVLSAALLAMPAATATVSAAYQRDFAQVLRVTEDLSNGGLELRNSIKDIARDIPVAFGDLTRVTQLGAQMGIANNQLADFTETTAKFVAVTGLSVDTASQLFGRLETSFNPDKTIPDFFNKVGASIAYVGAKTVATDPEIASMMNQIGSLGANVGMTADETIGLAAALASVRVQPELARGTLTRMFGQINMLAIEGAGAMESYGKVMGTTGEQAKAMWESDPAQFFNKVIEGLHGLDAAQKTVALDAMGIKASRDISAMTKLAVGYDVLEKSMAAANKGFSEGVALDEMSKPVFDTVVAKLQKLANAWSNLADSVGGASLAPLGAVIDMMADFANGLDKMIQHVPLVGGVIAALMGLSAVTAVFLGFKAAQAFVLAGLVGFQQMAGNRAITSAMSLSGVLKELGRTFQLLSGQTAASTAATGAHAAAAGAATAANGRLAASNVAASGALGRAGAGVRSFSSGLLALAGGPVGVALIGLTALISHLGLVQAEAEDAGKAIASAMKQGEAEGLQAAADQLKEIRVSLFSDSNGIGGMGKSVAEVANETGIGFDKVLKAVVKGKDGVAQFNSELDAFARSRGYKSLQDMNDQNPFKFAGEGPLLANLDFLKSKVEAVGNATTDAGTTAEITDEALGKLGATTAETEEDFTTAETAIDKMNDALKALNDTIFGTLNAETALQAAMASIGEGLGESGAFDTRSEGGRANIENLQGGLEAGRNYYKQLIDEGTLSAQQAAQGYAQFVDGLIAKIRATGGDVTPMVDLANQTKAAFDAALKTGYPSSVPVTVDTKEVPAKAVSVQQAIQTVLDNTEARAKVGVDVSDADAKLSDLANALSVITGLPYSVVLDALTDPAHEKAKQVYDVLTQVTDGTYKAAVDADTTAAITNVKNFATYAREELAQIQREYDYALQTGGDNAEGGFFRGSSNLALGRDWYGKGTTRARPAGPATTTVAAPKQVRAADLQLPELNFGAVADGYQKVQEEAEKTKKKTKELWQDQGDGIDEATWKINDYANRLRTGLMSAFDKQYGLSKATDDYHSALNAITKKREEELKQVSDLTEKIKELNNERNKDLIDANKAKIEQNISIKYGEGDRAADYGNQAQTALDAAAAKQKDIDASRKQRDEISAGIGKLTGFSDAAIANRNALRDLETKMIDMVVAYANTGASIDQVRAYAQRLTGQFQTDVGQIGFNMGAVAGLQGNLERYIGVVNRVPFLKPTKIEADTEEAETKINNLGRLMDEQTRPRKAEVTVDVKTGKVEKVAGYFLGQDEKNGGQQVWRNRTAAGNKLGFDAFNRGGPVPGMASGGMVPGTPPQNPRIDNMMAQVDGKGLIKVRSREFIQPEEAVDYYGPDFMEAIRTLSLPKFNMGGSPSGAGGSGYGAPAIVGLDAETLAFLASLKQDVRLYTENRLIAQAANDGNRELAAEGRNR